MPTVGGLPNAGSSEKEDVGVPGRPDQRLGANNARWWRGVRSAVAGNRRSDVGALGCHSVIDRYLPTENEIRILRVGRRLAVLFDVYRMPVVKRDFAVHAAAGDASRTGILLTAAKAIGKGVVGGDVIHRCGGLVVPIAPRLAAVRRDDPALVADDQNYAGVVRVDPAFLVVVAAGRAANGGPGKARVFGAPED